MTRVLLEMDCQVVLARREQAVCVLDAVGARAVAVAGRVVEFAGENLRAGRDRVG